MEENTDKIHLSDNSLSVSKELPFPNPIVLGINTSQSVDDLDESASISDASSSSDYNSCVTADFKVNDTDDNYTVSTNTNTVDTDVKAYEKVIQNDVSKSCDILENDKCSSTAATISDYDDDSNTSDKFEKEEAAATEEEKEEEEDMNDSDDDEKIISELISFDENFNTEILPRKQTAQSAYDRESKEVRGRPSACVFVASLSSNLNDDILCQSVTDHFKQWGETTLVKVLRDPANRPYAFVQYAKDEDANKAISEGQHSILNGRTVRCEKARVNRTLYLQLINTGITEKTMKKLLTKFGEIERLVAVNDNFNAINSGKSAQKNWFCKFVYRQDAISAFANLKSKANWNIEWAQNLEDEYSNVPEVTIDRYSIFVGHLDPRISKEELIERFEKHGKIKEAILVNRPLSNFAFIKFKTKEAAASAVESENHSMFKFKTIHVQYREMYNNYRRKFSNDNGLKLNLAPPPVNFKKRGFFTNKFGNNLNQNQYRTKPNNIYFNNGTNVPDTFANAIKMKHGFPSKNKFSFNYIGSRMNKNSPNYQKKFLYDTSNLASFEPYIPTNIDDETNNFGHDTSLDENVKVANNKDFCTSSADNKNYNSETKQMETIEDSNTEDNEPDNDEDEEIDIHINDAKTEENELSTMRSSISFSSAGPKTEYTYSSVDNGEHENHMNHLVQPNNFQYPYYYYYPPAKDIQYMNQMLPLDPAMTQSPNGIPRNTGYYYAYPPGFPNYAHPPGTSNGQIPAMYQPPYYVYYNPVSMGDHGVENLASGPVHAHQES